jgi:hypothetical protein
MKFSSETLNILKNFGNINQGILFKSGKLIKTVSPHKNILTQAEIEEEIPVDFGVYDLPHFLSTMSAFKDSPNLDFEEKQVLIVGSKGDDKFTYRFCEPTMIVLPPEKDIVMPEPEVRFELSAENFDKFMRAANILSSPQVAVKSDGRKVSIVAMDMQNDSAHTYYLDIAEGTGDVYQIVFKTENISKILSGAYDFSYSSKGVSHFQNKNVSLKYWITSEAGSSFTPK